MQICLNSTAYFTRDAQYEFANQAAADQVYAFHKSLPDYCPTPLHSLESLAHHLNINRLWVKDESQRFDLNAFKVLGASYAVAHVLAQHLGLAPNTPDYNELLDYTEIVARKEEYAELTLVTATDGNHGRAVAWAAQRFGCAAQVFLPAGASQERLDAIKAYGATAKILDGSYDQAVAHAAHVATQAQHILIQDTSWDTYTQVPQLITQGYFSLLTEAISQLPNQEYPTHVLVQGGVGSLPASLLARLTMDQCLPQKPIFIVVEPKAADCLFRSIAQNKGEPTSINGQLNTIMAGLACGTPSKDALAILRASADAFLSCSDAVAKRGMRVLGNPLGTDARIVSGESGAVTLGAVYELFNDPSNESLRQQIKLDKHSKVLLFSTEGDTAPDVYRSIVW